MTSDSFSSHSVRNSGGDLLELYLAGKLSEADAVRVDRWLEAHREAKALIMAFRDGVTEADVQPPDVHEMLKLVRARTGVTTQRRGHTGHASREFGHLERRSPRAWVSKGQTSHRGWGYALVGTIVGAMLIVAGWHVGAPRFGKHRQVAVLAYVTGKGERANITLPDGGTVALNVASRLEVPADYLAGNHTLRLTGEAVFTVQHDGKTPFTVLAGLVSARVLGTTFLVRHFPTDTVTTVSVRDGKVSVRSAAHAPVVLTAARQVVLGRTGSIGVRGADPAQFAFMTGVLPIDGMTWADAIKELARWYDADIRLGDPALATRRMTGEFTAGSLADLVTALEWTFNLRVVRDGRVVTLFPR